MAVWLEFPHSTKLSIQTSVTFEFIVWSRFPSSFIQIWNVNWTLNSFSSYECLSAEFKLSTCKDDASKGRPIIKTVITRRIGRLRPINLGSFSIEIHCNRSMIWSHICFINTSTLASSYNGKKSRYCYLESRQWFYLLSCFRENRRTNFVITCEIVDISNFFFFGNGLFKIVVFFFCIGWSVYCSYRARFPGTRRIFKLSRRQNSCGGYWTDGGDIWCYIRQKGITVHKKTT